MTDLFPSTEPSSLVSAGFYITRPVPRHAWLGDALLPAEILTLSACLAPLVPDVWALAWSVCSHDERCAELAKLGLPPETLPAVMAHATEAFDRGDLGWPHVWQSPAAARAMVHALPDLPADFAVYELGVPDGAVDALVEALAPAEGMGAGGLFSRLSARVAVAHEAEVMGWEVLGVDAGGGLHSWLCNGLHTDAHRTRSVTPGALGLLAHEDDARAVEARIAEGVGAEPAQWFRGCVLRVR